MDWQSITYETVVFDNSMDVRSALNSEQIEQLQAFFSQIKDKLKPGSFHVTDYVNTGGLTFSFYYMADENYFCVEALTGELGNAISVKGLDNTQAVYLVDKETWRAYGDLWEPFYEAFCGAAS